MKPFVKILVFVLFGASSSNGQIWTMPPEPGSVYRVYGPGGRTWLKESLPVADYGVAGEPAQIVTLTPTRENSSYCGVRAWFVEPNAAGGYDTYGPHGKTWASGPSAAGTVAGDGPGGRSWVSWQTSTDSQVTYEQGGRLWVTMANNAGGHTTYAPGGRAWISQPLASASRPCEPAGGDDAQGPLLPTPEYPLPVPAHSRPPRRAAASHNQRQNAGEKKGQEI